MKFDNNTASQIIQAAINLRFSQADEFKFRQWLIFAN